MSLPGRPPRGRAPEPSGSAMSASRGGILIGAAVVAGLLIFATIDNGGPAASNTTVVTTPSVVTPTVPGTNADGTATVTTAPSTTATTKAKKSTTTTVKSDSKTARANDQVVVQVLNGSGVQGAATQRSNDLKAKGYQVLPAGNAPATRTGTSVECKAGYEKEAAVLVTTLNGLGVPSTAEAVPDPLPAGFDAAANCYVLLGK
jgi:hypothetical protein